MAKSVFGEAVKKVTSIRSVGTVFQSNEWLTREISLYKALQLRNEGMIDLEHQISAAPKENESRS